MAEHHPVQRDLSSPTDKKTETVTYSTTGLTTGNYSATITVSDPNATDNPQTISVSLSVLTPSAIECDTTVLNPVVTVGGTAISQQFQGLGRRPGAAELHRVEGPVMAEPQPGHQLVHGRG